MLLAQGEPLVRWSQVGCRWSSRRSLTPARSAESRQPGLGFGDASPRPRHPRARWPHTDDEPRRIILDPSAASDRPVSPSTSPGRPIVTPGACVAHTPQNVPRWLEPVPPSLPRRKTRGRPIASPAGHNRRRSVWQVPSWRAIACELSTGLGAVCRASQQPPANHERWRPLAWRTAG